MGSPDLDWSFRTVFVEISFAFIKSSVVTDMLPYYTLTYLVQHCIATEIILNHFDQTSNPAELGLLMEASNA